MHKKYLLLNLLFIIPLFLFAQKSGVYTAIGHGKAASKDAALEAAQLDAVNVMVFTVLHRDSLYRDLFISEALRNGRILNQELQKSAAGLWQATITLEIDEGLADALYVGRYATTVINLLDQTETEVASIDQLFLHGEQAESEGNLGSAETYYTQAQTKIDTVLRFLNPVEDAYYFSSQGKRKAPELKILMASYKENSIKGIERVRKAQSQLNMAQNIAQTLLLYEQIEKALLPIETVRDNLFQISISPRGYTEEQLRTTQLQCKQQQKSLYLQKMQFLRASEGLDLSKSHNSESYISKRKVLLELRITELDRQLVAINSKLSRELFWRSNSISALRWVVNHEPAHYFSLGVRLPIGLKPEEQGPEINTIPLNVQFYAGGPLPLESNHGLWLSTKLQTGSEYVYANHLKNIQQEVVLGFYKSRLFGLGIRWDWNREEQKPIVALESIWGNPGNEFGQKSIQPLWLHTLSWEIPRESNHILAYLNGGLVSTFRPNSFLGLSTKIASRVRYDSSTNTPFWVGSAGVDFFFRLPILRPFQWSIGWEGYMSSLLDGQSILPMNTVSNDHTFTCGIHYVF
ncbi:hypothetical protein [Gracilinema caldarium]|uniref:Uncharacterized protein n=1 Tax=Gracilinema caldarium (strain ATCC 51460 / DSM 7334 / H1) TaxID=744872 RepID=F8EX73_GRAC1|nr:hypothetical protein [Gracilinema caldarium]AEJ18816.1 hypothetical protein Spica_0662 [Gracilinema caldarium DSM 7334]